MDEVAFATVAFVGIGTVGFLSLLNEFNGTSRQKPPVAGPSPFVQWRNDLRRGRY